MNISSSSLILPSTSGPSYTSVLSEIIPLWLVSVLILSTFCYQFNLNCLMPCTTFSASSRTIHFFRLHSVSRTHSSGCQMCSLYVSWPLNYSFTWLRTLYNGNWMAHVNLFLKTFFTVPFVPLHIPLTDEIFHNQVFHIWCLFNNISIYNWTDN